MLIFSNPMHNLPLVFPFLATMPVAFRQFLFPLFSQCKLSILCRLLPVRGVIGRVLVTVIFKGFIFRYS